jgi:ribosome-binding factor A
MMPGRRVERLNEQFRRELTEVLRGEAKDPRVEGVTLTAVRVDPDLSFARVFVAPSRDEAVNEEALAGLRAAMPFLRKELGARLHIRRIPEMRFELDLTLAHANRIEELLHQVAADRPVDAAAAADVHGQEHAADAAADVHGHGQPAEAQAGRADGDVQGDDR